jgi:hypothetical protein
VRELDDPGDVGRRADRVGCDREGHHSSAARQLRLQVVEIERQVVVHARKAHDDAEVMGELEPGGDVGVVVELGADDLVARLQRPRERPRQEKVQGGHARPERDLVRMAGEEPAGRHAGLFDQLDRVKTRLVRRADVRVVLAEVVRDRVDHLVRALGATGAVEEHERAVQGRESRPDRVDIEHCRAHASSAPFTVQR